VRVRTYWFSRWFNEAYRDLGSQPSPRADHVEACRPRGCSYANQSSPSGASFQPCHNLFMERRAEWLPPIPATPTSASTPTGPPPPPPLAPLTFEEPRPETTGPFEPPRPSLWRRVMGPIAIVGALIVKLAAKLKFILLLLPKIKLLTTSGTMLVSIAAYSLFWGWKFAVGFVALIFIHEMGHVIQLRREGIKASAPMFIPFLGAVVAMKEMPRNALMEARVGLAGPVLGSLAAAALIPIWAITGDQYWEALAFVGLFLNLFNLLPVVPLDGGRAMAAMSPKLWLAGFAGIVALAIVFPNPIMLLILLFAGMETWRRWRARKAGGPEQEAYYKVKPIHRVLVAVVYVGLIVALGVGMHYTHVPRSLP
jgi:Zn-dependent protease